MVGSDYTFADGCDEECRVVRGWQCNHGNPHRPDYCFETCGDGIDFRHYECDDGLTPSVGKDGCDDSCKVDLGMVCTGGALPLIAAPGTLRPDICTEICGDDVDLFFYPCDDGNTNPGDGCDANCNIEPGWDCAGGTRDWGDECWHWHNNPAIISVSMPDFKTFDVAFNVSVSLKAGWED